MSEDRIEGTLKKGAGRVQDAFGGLTGDDATQAKGKINEIAGGVQDTYGKVMGQAQDALGDVSARAQNAFNDVSSRAQDFYGDAEQFAQENPLLALGVAAGVGVVIGLLLAGGRKTVYVRK